MADPDWSRVARAVRERRAELGLTQEQLAAAGGPSVGTLKKIESAKGQRYRPIQIADLERALGWARGSIAALSEGGDAAPAPISDFDLHEPAETTLEFSEAMLTFESTNEDMAMLAGMLRNILDSEETRRAIGMGMLTEFGRVLEQTQAWLLEAEGSARVASLLQSFRATAWWGEQQELRQFVDELDEARVMVSDAAQRCEQITPGLHQLSARKIRIAMINAVEDLIALDTDLSSLGENEIHWLAYAVEKGGGMAEEADILSAMVVRLAGQPTGDLPDEPGYRMAWARVSARITARKKHMAAFTLAAGDGRPLDEPEPGTDTTRPDPESHR